MQSAGAGGAVSTVAINGLLQNIGLLAGGMVGGIAAFFGL